jgi:hypothetical protein
MKELEEIVAELKKALAAKGKEIDMAGCCAIMPVKDAFKLREMEVVSFERSTYKVMADSTIKSALIERYRNDAHELLGMISRILV